LSCYEWEAGTIVIPAKVWVKFRKDVIKAWNDRQEWTYTKALELYERLIAAGKGKRGYDYWEAFTRMASDCRELPDHEHYTIRYSLFNRDGKSASPCKKPLKPQKKQWPKLPVSKGCSISYEGCGIALNDAEHSVEWFVMENNHAREHAHEEWMTQQFFKLLGAVKFTRGTGGKILGNDEYNRDSGSEYEGGGGSYVTHEYGPHVKPVRQFDYSAPLTRRRW